MSVGVSDPRGRRLLSPHALPVSLHGPVSGSPWRGRKELRVTGARRPSHCENGWTAATSVLQPSYLALLVPRNTMHVSGLLSVGVEAGGPTRMGRPRDRPLPIRATGVNWASDGRFSGRRCSARNCSDVQNERQRAIASSDDARCAVETELGEKISGAGSSEVEGLK